MSQNHIQANNNMEHNNNNHNFSNNNINQAQHNIEITSKLISSMKSKFV